MFNQHWAFAILNLKSSIF